MAITIRLATVEDVPRLKELIEASVRALSTGLYTPEQIASALRHVFGVDSQLIADSTYYVACKGNDLVGCGGWSKRRTLFGGDQMKAAEDDLLDPAVDAGRIGAFFVHPDWARRGIGRSIIEACEAEARRQGFSRMTLAATIPGEPLYAAAGYKVTERFVLTMPDGVTLPLAHMERTL